MKWKCDYSYHVHDAWTNWTGTCRYLTMSHAETIICTTGRLRWHSPVENKMFKRFCKKKWNLFASSPPSDFNGLWHNFSIELFLRGNHCFVGRCFRQKKNTQKHSLITNLTHWVNPLLKYFLRTGDWNLFISQLLRLGLLTTHFLLAFCL